MAVTKGFIDSLHLGTGEIVAVIDDGDVYHGRYQSHTETHIDILYDIVPSELLKSAIYAHRLSEIDGLYPVRYDYNRTAAIFDRQKVE